MTVMRTDSAVAEPESGLLPLSGNEAIARGAWEAGVKVAAAYPGTPSTEILESIAEYPAEDVHAQWSTNEKTACDVAIGASFARVRALTAKKHVGLNVASDALMSQSYIGVNGGLVLAVCDDPGIHSSQNEQDTRLFGRLACVPVLEPADAQEALDFTRRALEGLRRRGLRVGLFRPITLWPFPAESFAEAARDAGLIAVAEMNDGQLALEIERHVRSSDTVVPVNRLDGEPIMPREIETALARACGAVAGRAVSG